MKEIKRSALERKLSSWLTTTLFSAGLLLLPSCAEVPVRPQPLTGAFQTPGSVEVASVREHLTVPNLRGMDPLQYQRIYSQAEQMVKADEWRARYRAHDSLMAPSEWQRARALLEQLVAAYPYDGVVWRWLGLAANHTGDFVTAGPALARALELGVPSYPEATAADAAKAFARAGNAEAAILWIRRALNHYRHVEPESFLSDPAFKSLQNLPEYVELLESRAPLEHASRDSRWRNDIDFYIAEVRRIKPHLPPKRLQSMVAAAEFLKGQVAQLADTEIAAALEQIAAMQKQGHNSFNFWWRKAPIMETAPLGGPVDYYLFADGLFIVGGDAAHRHLVGSEVLSFGTHSVEEALRRASTLIARDNEMGAVDQAPVYLSRPQVLHALGLSATPEAWTVKIRTHEGVEQVQTLRPADEFRVGTAGLPVPRTDDPLPLYLKNRNDFHWMQELDPSTLYVQVNLTWDSKAQSLEDFGKELRERLRSSDINSVVLDLRHNPGGNTYLYRELLRTLIAFDAQRGTQLYVLTSRRTYSATANLVVELDRLTDAIVVGEPLRTRPVSPSDPVEITLPNSRVPGGISSTIWALTAPTDTRRWIPPTIPIPLYSRDYFNNEDPVLKVVQEHIRRSAPADPRG